MSDYLARLLARSQPGPLQPASVQLAASDDSQEMSDPFGEETVEVAPPRAPSVTSATATAPAATLRTSFAAVESAPPVVQTVQSQPGSEVLAAPARDAPQPTVAEKRAPAPLRNAALVMDATRESTGPRTTQAEDSTHRAPPAPREAGEQAIAIAKRDAVEAVVVAAAPHEPPTTAPPLAAPAVVDPGAAELQKLLRWLQSTPARAEDRSAVESEADQERQGMARSSPRPSQSLTPSPPPAPTEPPAVRPLLSIGRLVVEVTPPAPPLPTRPIRTTRPATPLRTETGVTSKLRFGMGQL